MKIVPIYFTKRKKTHIHMKAPQIQRKSINVFDFNAAIFFEITFPFVTNNSIRLNFSHFIYFFLFLFFLKTKLSLFPLNKLKTKKKNNKKQNHLPHSNKLNYLYPHLQLVAIILPKRLAHLNYFH